MRGGSGISAALQKMGERDRVSVNNIGMFGAALRDHREKFIEVGMVGIGNQFVGTATIPSIVECRPTGNIGEPNVLPARFKDVPVSGDNYQSLSRG